MPLYSLIINWNDRNPGEGTYGATVRADTSDAAEALVREMMLKSITEERGIEPDDTETFGTCVECSEGAAWEAGNMEKVLKSLLQWEQESGGSLAPCWQDARELIARIDALGLDVTT